MRIRNGIHRHLRVPINDFFTLTEGYEKTIIQYRNIGARNRHVICQRTFSLGFTQQFRRSAR
jgi:hypothetical protein